jgi:hypothetical protein
MTAWNAVRFRVKPGYEDEFLAAHRALRERFPGARKVALFKTGDRTYCIVGEWTGMTAIAKARPKMIGLLDSFRHTLEDLGNGLGVTDPVSGEVVFERSFAKPKPKAKAAAKKAKPAAKKPAKKPAKKTAKKPARRR